MADRGARGAVRARGGGRGRGNKAPAGKSNAPPLAAQMKQLHRLDEPKEMALFRRFADLGVTQVLSVYGPSGLLDQKLKVPSGNFRPGWGINPSTAAETLLTLLQGESILLAIGRQKEAERLLSRRAARLPAADAARDLSDLSDEQLEILRLSNAEYARRFPGNQGNGAAAGGGAALPIRQG